MPILIGGGGLVKGTIKGFGPALRDLSEEFAAEVQNSQWLVAAPFESVSLIVRYSKSTNHEVEIGRINKHQELEVATQASISELRDPKGDVERLKEVLRPYINRALLEVGKKYGLGAYAT